MIATKGSQATKLLRFGANLVKNEELLSVAQKNAVRCIASSTSFSSGSIPNAASNTSPQQMMGTLSSPTAAASRMFNRGFAAQPQPVEEKEESSPTPVSGGGITSPPVCHPGSPVQLNNANEDNCVEYAWSPHYDDKAYLEGIKPFHRSPKTVADYTGFYGVKLLRSSFDLATNYGPGKMNSKKWLTRFLFLETVAGVPGFAGAMHRHLRSLRTMQRDKGWISTLLEEAENERMHLITFMEMSKPGLGFRSAVIGTQGIFMTLYTLFYAISPRHCHAFVSYLEEEAVTTYSHCIEEIDEGKLPEWETIAVPKIALKYWGLPKEATMRDLLLAIRADELSHNHVNEVFANMKKDDPNPFTTGTTIVG